MKPNASSLIALAVATTACSSTPSGPTVQCSPGPDTPLAEAGCLTFAPEIDPALSDSLRSWIVPIVDRVADDLDIGGVRMRVSGPGNRVIGGFGVGGFATRETVELQVDPDDLTRPEGLRAWVEQLTAHELHHVARLRAVGNPGTVGGLATFEGMADHYALNFGAGLIPPWSAALQGGDLAHWRDRIVAEHPQRDYDVYAWLFGTTLEIPRWTGYAVGFDVVGKYLTATGSSAAASAGASTDDIIAMGSGG